MNNILDISIIFALILLVSYSECRGVSRKKLEDFNTRFSDFVGEEIPCEMPPIVAKLPVGIKTKVELIWKDVDPNSRNCWIEMARTRNVLLRLTPKERNAIMLPTKECKIPSIVDALPTKFQKRINEIWAKNAGKASGNCFEQQRKTRLLLLNMPLGLKNKFQPPAFECALPHFYNRLERELQEKLDEIWKGYRRGESCVEQIDRQIQLLEANDISLKSFQMPPPAMFRKREILRKLQRRENVA